MSISKIDGILSELVYISIDLLSFVDNEMIVFATKFVCACTYMSYMGERCLSFSFHTFYFLVRKIRLNFCFGVKYTKRLNANSFDSRGFSLFEIIFHSKLLKPILVDSNLVP